MECSSSQISSGQIRRGFFVARKSNTLCKVHLARASYTWNNLFFYKHIVSYEAIKGFFYFYKEKIFRLSSLIQNPASRKKSEFFFFFPLVLQQNATRQKVPRTNTFNSHILIFSGLNR